MAALMAVLLLLPETEGDRVAVFGDNLWVCFELVLFCLLDTFLVYTYLKE